MSSVTDTTNVKKSRAHLEDLSLKPARDVVFNSTKDPMSNEAVRDFVSAGLGNAGGTVSEETFVRFFEDMKKEVRPHLPKDLAKVGTEEEFVKNVSLFINYSRKNAPHTNISIQCEEYCEKKMAKTARSNVKYAEKERMAEEKAMEKELSRLGGNQPFVLKEENWEGKAYDAYRKPGVVEVVPKGIPNMSAILSKFDKNIAEEARQSRMIALKKNSNVVKPITVTSSNFEDAKFNWAIDRMANGKGYYSVRDDPEFITATGRSPVTPANESVATTVKDKVPMKAVVTVNKSVSAFLANSLKEKAKKEAEKQAKIAEKKVKRDIEVAERKAAKKAKKEAEKAANAVPKNEGSVTPRPTTSAQPTLKLDAIKGDVFKGLEEKKNPEPHPLNKSEGPTGNDGGDGKVHSRDTGPPPLPPTRKYVAYERFIANVLNDNT